MARILIVNLHRDLYRPPQLRLELNLARRAAVDPDKGRNEGLAEPMDRVGRAQATTAL